MKEILSDTALDHKFVKVLRRINPAARWFRKAAAQTRYPKFRKMALAALRELESPADD